MWRWPPQALHDVGQVERLAVPRRHGLLACDKNSGVLQVLNQFAGSVEADWRRRRTSFERPSPRISELHGAVPGQSHPEAAFVEKAVMSPTEEHEVRELRLAAVGPMDDVVSVTVLRSAAGEAATLVAELESTPDGWRNGPRLAADAQDLARSVGHAHLAGVGGDAPGCFRGNRDMRVPEPGASWGRRLAGGFGPT